MIATALKVGQGYYVMLPGQHEVSRVEIRELTDKTVLFAVETPIKGFGGVLERVNQRYATEQVVFLEKLYG